MLILDSSVIISLFKTDDINHLRAKSILDLNDKYYVLDYVLSEVLTVLKMRANHTVASNCGRFLIDNNDFIIRYTSGVEFKATLDFFLANKNKLSFVDSLILTVSDFEDLEFKSFDKELLKMKN